MTYNLDHQFLVRRLSVHTRRGLTPWRGPAHSEVEMVMGCIERVRYSLDLLLAPVRVDESSFKIHPYRVPNGRRG